MPACPQCATQYADAVRFCGRCGAALAGADPGAADEPDPWLERVVDGRYRVLGRLGSGGMGIVYRVEHLRLGKIAAMKVLSPDTAGNREMVQRFRREAQAVSRLNHPNIVQTFDFGQWDGALYLIMEYVKGDDLATLLKREGALSFVRAAKLFVQVCSALTDAHDAGIIHRDLKPENLMVIRRRDGSEHAKVLDFGLAKLREREEAAAAITSGAQVLGTPYYMAPEQVRGEELDPRADVYSLGATLYRVLTGTPPFQAPSPISVLAKHLTDEVVPPSSRAPELTLPPEADRIVLRAMAKTVEQRYGSAAEVQRDLEQALATVAAAPAPVAAAFHGATAAATSQNPDARQASIRAPTLAVDESDIVDRDGGGERLRRRDVEAFERSLRRRHLLVRWLLPLGALAGVAVLVIGFGRLTREKAETAEREPNNAPGYANLLPQGAPVRGTIGRLIEDKVADIDYYRVPTGKGERAVTARVEGVPGIDLVLELFDGQGRRLAKGDAYGRGWGEWLQPFAVGPGEVYVAVREVRVEGQPPVERPDDPYTLTVRWGPPQPGWEVEPNDWEASATAVSAGKAVRGYLGDAEDKDWFVVTPTAAGPVTLRVSAPAGVDVVLLRESAAPPPESAAPPPRHDAGKAIDKQGPGQEEVLTVAGTAGQPIRVGVARKPAAVTPAKERKATAGRKETEPDPKDEAPPIGLDEPYELRVE